MTDLLAAGSASKGHLDAVLEAIAGLEGLQADDILEGLDRVPTDLLAVLARDNPARFQASLASYARSLERAVARRHFQYADLVARRMRAIFQASRDPDIKAQALQALLIASVVLNRYAAMSVFKLLLYQIKDAEICAACRRDAARPPRLLPGSCLRPSLRATSPHP